MTAPKSDDVRYQSKASETFRHSTAINRRRQLSLSVRVYGRELKIEGDFVN